MQSLPSSPHILSPIPFCGNGDRSTIPNVSSQTEMNWNDGFPQIFSKLISDGGKYVNRKDMNAILYSLSNELLFHLWGGMVMFDQLVSNAIGGYPQHAKLFYKDQHGNVSLIESQVPNNSIAPSESTIDAKTDSDGNYNVEGIIRWKTVLSSTAYSWMPNLKATYVDVKGEIDSSASKTWTSSDNGYIHTIIPLISNTGIYIDGIEIARTAHNSDNWATVDSKITPIARGATVTYSIYSGVEPSVIRFYPCVGYSV